MSILGIGRFRVIPGWTYRGVRMMFQLSKELQRQLENVGNHATEKKWDRYIFYENTGFVTASSKHPLVNWYTKIIHPRNRTKRR